MKIQLNSIKYEKSKSKYYLVSLKFFEQPALRMNYCDLENPLETEYD